MLSSSLDAAFDVPDCDVDEETCAEERADELLVLQSIYGEEHVVECDPDDGALVITICDAGQSFFKKKIEKKIILMFLFFFYHF